MRRFIIIALALISLSALVFAGCSTTTPSATTSSTAPASTTAAPQVITLRYADQNPKDGWEGQNAMQPWIAAMEQATNGRVKFEVYDAQTLTKGTDAWEALKGGVADVAWCFHGYWAGMTPLADVISLPSLPFKSAEQASGIFWQLYQKYPTMQQEFADNHVVLTWTSNPYFLITTNKEVKTIDDLKGLKLRLTGGPPTELGKALGISPVNVGMPDTYANLQKGVMDGMMDPWEALYSFRHYEVVKYYTFFPSFVVYFTQAFSNAAWNKLPPDIQQEIESVGGLEGSKFWGKNMFDTAEGAARAAIKAGGYTMIENTFSAADDAKLADLAQPLWDKWVQDNTAAGRPEAADILKTTQDLIKSYNP
jgi:TRAP-type C4-dicarboxylate transport system substrate-binding protein